MRPPSRWLVPGAGTAMPPPPRPSGGGARGPEGPPRSPPPLPLRPKSGQRQTKETAAPYPLQRGRCTRGAGAPRPRQAPARPARCWPTADRRRPGRRKRSCPIRGRPGEDGGANQRGGPPPPPPPAALTRWEPTGPHLTPAAARQPPRHEYTPGGHAGDNGWQADAQRGGWAGGRPPHPPPATPPSFGATGAALRPPGAERIPPPPPQKGPRRGGGGFGWTCTPRAPAPPAACSRVGRDRRASPHQRAGATRAPSLGAAHGGAPEQYGGRAPHDPPVTTAHSGRAEGRFRSAGAPGGAVHGPPLTPPQPGAAPRPRSHTHAGGKGANDTRPEWGTAGPPPPPPPARKPRGPRPPTPEAGGMVPPPRPREEPERDPPPRRSRRLPQGPRRTREPAPTRQDAAQIASSEGGQARTGVVWGAKPPMDKTTPVTPALLPAQGRQRDRTRQSDPPPYRPPSGRTNGGYGARPPPPPTSPPPGTRTPRTRLAARSPHRACRPRGQRRAPTPARPVGGQSGEGERLTPDAPRNSGRQPPRGRPSATPTTPSQVGGGRADRRPPSTPDRARDRGRTRGGAWTTWNGPTSGQCRNRARCARRTTREGGERTPREGEGEGPQVRELTWPAFLEGGAVLRITDADANIWLPRALRSALAHWRYRRRSPPPQQPQPPHKQRRR